MKSAKAFCTSILIISAAFTSVSFSQQRLNVDPRKRGKTFEGVGAVSGGGATSVLLKDYPIAQRNEILDILFKPRFAASMQTLYVEVGADSNSTQGSEPTHQRTRADENYFRGYEWWLMAEARKRNPQLTLDACAWGCPGWIGDGQFWSQDMADYYVKWIKGLRANHGLDLDAIGCRNERGSVTDWVKLFRKTLDAAGMQAIRIHGFDNAGESKWDWLPQLQHDPELAASVNILGNHTLGVTTQPSVVRELSEKLNKPIWNTEEHVYNGEGRSYSDDYALAIGMVHLFNDNYIAHGATKIVNWYLVGSTYACEPYADQPPAMIARQPWSGHYQIKPTIWAYAHYGQFTEVGWKYLNDGCAPLNGGGSVVSLASPEGKDFSIIAETAGAKAAQRVSIRLSDTSHHTLCLWRSSRDAQFVRQPELAVGADSILSLTLEPDCIYSISTTTGQQKGQFDSPPEKSFPLPYADDFEGYGDAKQWGYLPHYTADICGIFELVDRPDGHGHALRQVVTRKAQSWAPEWMPYTVLGDERWTDYEVSADIQVDDGWAGLIGRVSNTGNGWEDNPNGYYVRLYADGGCALYKASQKLKGSRDQQLAIGFVKPWQSTHWHNVTLRFEQDRITVLVDRASVLSVMDDEFKAGLAGLITGGEGDARNAALFDNLVIRKPDEPPGPPRLERLEPLYKADN